MKSKVYFTKEITSASLVKIYESLGVDLKGKVGVKISTGEPGGHKFLNPKLIEKLVKTLNVTIIECCTAYGGKRQDCDIMDEFEEMGIPVTNGFH